MTANQHVEFVDSILDRNNNQRYEIIKSEADETYTIYRVDVDVYVTRTEAIALYNKGNSWESVKSRLQDGIHDKFHYFCPILLARLPSRQFRSYAYDKDAAYNGAACIAAVDPRELARAL